MITKVHIENFKSVANLDIELGRINVFIGENGCGKSNILEGIAVGSASAHEKLDNEFLASRGVRVTDARFMRTALADSEAADVVKVKFEDDRGAVDNEIDSDQLSGKPSRHEVAIRRRMTAVATQQRTMRATLDALRNSSLPDADVQKTLSDLVHLLNVLDESVRSIQLDIDSRKRIPEILIYAPENSALRTFQAEGHVLPLGVKGEGLFAHLRELATSGTLEKVIAELSLIDWFETFDIPDDLVVGERRLHIRDRYLAEGALIDQRSANEGFLLLLFYFTLFISPKTPAFIIIDNIDTSLNPKLCRKLVTELIALAKAHDKQAILTTHNPAVLDGLNLHENDQRLFVITRNSDGATTARRVFPPKPLDGDPPIAMSEAFVRGYIGGLPDNF